METEESIVYQLLDESSGGTINNDEPIGERLVRAFLREQRSHVIGKLYGNGLTVVGPEFQSLGVLTLNLGTNGYTIDLPPMIQLKYNSGIRITTGSGNNIPVMSKEAFYEAKANIVTGHMPKAFMTGQELTVHEGVKGTSYMNAGTRLTDFVNEITNDKKILVEAILMNPDDGLNYDWTSSPYPLSGELLAVVKARIKKYNFGMILSTKEDEVANMKHDNIRYHDQGKVD